MPLDDLVLTSMDEQRISASIKSFDMVSGAKLPAGFVEAAWRRRLASDFDEEREWLGLVCAATTATAWRSLNKLVKYAAADDAHTLAERIAQAGMFNSTDRKIWASAALPDELADELAAERGTSAGLLLRCLRPLRLDFDQVASEAEAQAQRWCDEALLPGQRGGPPDLWHALQVLASEINPAGGTMDWPTLTTSLRQFTFALRPDARHDWALLDDHTHASLANVRSELSGGIQLPRTDALNALTAAADVDRAVLCAGPSGCGKSSLVAVWARQSPRHALWLRTWHLDGGLTGLGLRSSVMDCLRLAAGETRIVVDGLDGTGDREHLEAVAELARVVASSEHLKLVITCSELAVDRVARDLRMVNAPIDSGPPLLVGNLSDDEVDAILARRAELRRLADAGRLGPLLKRLKLLDLILQTLDGIGPDVLRAAHDETSIAEVWWTQIATGPTERATRAEFVQGLAVAQADAMRSATSLGDLGPLTPLVRVADDLRVDGVLDSDERRYAFAHDLFGDWARMEWLSGRGDDLPAGLGDKTSRPTWHRAIRLFALRTLRTEGVAEWSRVRRLSATADPVLALLFLDAPLLAADAEDVLEALWPELVVDNGMLLNEGLNRFWSIASLPDPRGRALFEGSPQMLAHWEATARVPLASLWPSVLAVLGRHADDVAELAAVQAADIVNLWLRAGPRSTSADADAAVVGLRLLSDLLSPSRPAFRDSGLRQRVWRAGIAAGAVHPQHVFETVSAALDADKLDSRDNGWMDAHDINDIRSAVLDGDTLVPMTRGAADLAARLAVACTLTPGSGCRPDEFGETAAELEIVDPIMLTALPELGPFHALLQASPEAGLSAVIAIVEHTTERWRLGGGVHRDTDSLDGRLFEMLIDGNWRPLSGDVDVMHWHRGHATTPSVLAGALMALERWILERLEAGDNIDAVFAAMLSSRSLALVGVAVEAACAHPELLLGPLRPLASSAGVLLADRLYKRHPHSDLQLAGAPDAALMARLAKWNRMRHRDVELQALVISHVASGRGLVEELRVARARWASADPEGWRYLLAQTDMRAWRHVVTAEGEAVQPVLPDELQREVDRDQPSIAREMFWMTFPFEMRQLLDGPEDAAKEDPEALWRYAQSALESDPPRELAEMGIRIREDCTCALAAVMIARHPNWLAAFADRSAWCRAQLLDALDARPREFVAGPDDPATDRWDIFCAEALPRLLASAPRDMALREAAVALIVNRRLHRVATTFHRFTRIPELAEDLRRLEHLSLVIARLLAWDAERRHRQRLVEQGFAGPSAADLPDVPAEFDDAARRFLTGTLSSEAPLVSEYLAGPQAPLVRSRPGSRHRFALALSPEYLLASNGHRLRLDDVSEAERQRRLRFAADLAELLAESLETRDYQTDRWQMDLVFSLGGLAGSLASADARRLWLPMLTLATSPASKCDIFMRYLWRSALADTRSQERVTFMLQELLTEAHSAEWPRNPDSGVVQAIAGVDGSLLTSWDVRHRPLLSSVQPAWRTWLEPYIRQPFMAQALARFVARPAASAVRPTILRWLREAKLPSARWNQDDAAHDELVTWLYEHTTVLVDASEEGDDARAVLAMLVASGSRVAQALSDRLG